MTRHTQIFFVALLFGGVLFLFSLPSLAVELPSTSATSNAAAKATTTTAPDTPREKKKYTLKEAIAWGVENAKLRPAAPTTGFLGIPGAPQINFPMAFLWALWVGWIFSTVGAFGGVMAGVGHMNLLGLGAYASSFGAGTPLNVAVTDSIRVSNQCLVGCSALVSSIKYRSLGRIIFPLGIALGIGALAGATLIPWLTQGKLSFGEYQKYFGIFVLLLGCYQMYETLPAARAKRKKTIAAAQAFEAACTTPMGKEIRNTSVQIVGISAQKVVFTFCSVEFSFNPILPVLGGFFIAAISSFLGIGGGFLLVSFMTSISQLPMYLTAGTSAFAVLVTMITSISAFMFGGATAHWPLVGIELVGIVAGSWVGPITAKYISDTWLKRLFTLLAFAVGLDYVLRIS